jgi:hypothetical protein
MTPDERKRHARRAARARWSRSPDLRYKRLQQIGAAHLSAITNLRIIIGRLESTQRVELEHWLHRAINTFANLWVEADADLPQEYQDYLAGVRHQLREHVRQTAQGAATGSAS